VDTEGGSSEFTQSDFQFSNKVISKENRESTVREELENLAYHHRTISEKENWAIDA